MTSPCKIEHISTDRPPSFDEYEQMFELFPDARSVNSVSRTQWEAMQHKLERFKQQTFEAMSRSVNPRRLDDPAVCAPDPSAERSANAPAPVNARFPRLMVFEAVPLPRAEELDVIGAGQWRNRQGKIMVHRVEGGHIQWYEEVDL